MRLDNEDHPVSQVFLVRMESLELMVLMDRTAFPEKPVHVDFKALKDRLVSQFPGQKVQEVSKDHKVQKGLKVFPEEMANKVNREILVLKVEKVKLVNQREDFLVFLVSRALLVSLANLVNPVCSDHPVKWVLEVRQADPEKSGPLARMDKKERQVNLEKRRLDTLVLRAIRVLTVFPANKDQEDYKASRASKEKPLSALKVSVVPTASLEKMVSKDQEDSLVQWVQEEHLAKMAKMAKTDRKARKGIKAKLENQVRLERLDDLAKTESLEKTDHLVQKEKSVHVVTKAKRENVEKKARLGEWASLIGSACVRCSARFQDLKARKVFLAK